MEHTEMTATTRADTKTFYTNYSRAKSILFITYNDFTVLIVWVMVYGRFNTRFSSNDAYWEQRLHKQKQKKKS